MLASALIVLCSSSGSVNPVFVLHWGNRWSDRLVNSRGILDLPAPRAAYGNDDGVAWVESGTLQIRLSSASIAYSTTGRIIPAGVDRINGNVLSVPDGHGGILKLTTEHFAWKGRSQSGGATGQNLFAVVARKKLGVVFATGHDEVWRLWRYDGTRATVLASRQGYFAGLALAANGDIAFGTDLRGTTVFERLRAGKVHKLSSHGATLSLIDYRPNTGEIVYAAIHDHFGASLCRLVKGRKTTLMSEEVGTAFPADVLFAADSWSWSPEK